MNLMEALGISTLKRRALGKLSKTPGLFIRERQVKALTSQKAADVSKIGLMLFILSLISM